MSWMLMVDDSRADRALMIQSITQAGLSIEIVEAENAPSAFTSLKRAQVLPDVVLLDLRMPVFDGMYVLQVLKQRPDWQGIPVVVFSSTRDPKEKRACLDAGAACVRSKPLVWDDYVLLAQALKAFLERGCSLAAEG